MWWKDGDGDGGGIKTGAYPPSVAWGHWGFVSTGEGAGTLFRQKCRHNWVGTLEAKWS